MGEGTERWVGEREVGKRESEGGEERERWVGGGERDGGERVREVRGEVGERGGWGRRKRESCVGEKERWEREYISPTPFQLSTLGQAVPPEGGALIKKPGSLPTINSEILKDSVVIWCPFPLQEH